MKKEEMQLLEIIRFYGEEKQTMKAIEELTELMEVLVRQLLSNEPVNIKPLLEESVDVMIMIKQLWLMFDIGDLETQLMEEYKINRTLERIQIQKELKND